MHAEELYRLPPEEFTAARDAEAKRRRVDGDRDGAAAVKALRRPSVAAWLVNRLAERSPGLLEGLLELGPGLAEAQSTGDAAALRALGVQRRRLVEAVTSSAVADVGRPVTATVREEIAATLEAALADPSSAQAVRSGRLVRSLSYAGFGEVDLADAVAPADRTTPGRGTGDRDARPRRGGTEAAARARREHAARVAAAQQAAHEAAGRLDDAVRAFEAAERRRAQARRTAEAAGADVERLVGELVRARAQAEDATSAAAAAGRAADEARAQVQQAQDRAEDARDALGALRGDTDD